MPLLLVTANNDEFGDVDRLRKLAADPRKKYDSS
jgi:hypothetical protein